jgi:hypothetical protein
MSRAMLSRFARIGRPGPRRRRRSKAAVSLPAAMKGRREGAIVRGIDFVLDVEAG